MKTIRKYDFVILDFDGTICDLRVDWVGLKRELFDRFSENYGWNNPIRLMEMVNIIYSYKNMRHISEMLEVIKTFETPNNAPSYTNVNVKLLQAVDEFYIISNNLHETINIALRQMQVINRCKAIIGIDDVKKSKPDIAPFHLLCSITGSKQSTSYIMIGDSPTDQAFANNSNIEFRHVNSIL